jgi:pyridoxal phosphate enzyme (YggS family)
VNDERLALSARLEDIRGRIARAAARSKRDAGAVTLVAVTKTVPAERVREAVALGLRDLGESRVQEAEEKIPAVGGASEGGRPRWHLIGHLQRNKAARAAKLFDRVHAVDRLELAEALSRHALESGRNLAVMIEVNVAGAASQFGVAPGEIAGLVAEVSRRPGLRLDGLMTVGPPVERAEAARPLFAALRSLRDRAAHETGVTLGELSMGMSGDFEVAIEEGSTMVRVGTALFGTRA